MIKEREKSMLVRYCMVIWCALAQCTCMCIQSLCSGIPGRVCEMQKGYVFIIEVTGGIFDVDWGLFDG